MRHGGKGFFKVICDSYMIGSITLKIIVYGNIFVAFFSSIIWHVTHDVLKLSVWYSRRNGHKSSGVATGWRVNQSDAKLLEDGVVQPNSKYFYCPQTQSKLVSLSKWSPNIQYIEHIKSIYSWQTTDDISTSNVMYTHAPTISNRKEPLIDISMCALDSISGG